MKLRYKINLVATGYCLCGAFVMALAGKLGLMSILFFLGWLNWTTALNSETKGDE